MKIESKHDVGKFIENRDDAILMPLQKKLEVIYHMITRTEYTCMHVLFLIQKF